MSTMYESTLSASLVKVAVRLVLGGIDFDDPYVSEP